MTQCTDLQGQVFGHLTAVSYQHRAMWHCRCACGQTVLALTQQLKTGRITSCGCQPPVPVERVPHHSLPLALEITALLTHTPLLTSKAIAEAVKVPYLSLVGVMNALKRKGIVGAWTPEKGRRPVNQWELLIDCEDVPAHFQKADEAEVVAKGFNGEIGITEEDDQWMRHYRTQWINRYRRMGQKPPISKFV